MWVRVRGTEREHVCCLKCSYFGSEKCVWNTTNWLNLRLCVSWRDVHWQMYFICLKGVLFSLMTTSRNAVKFVICVRMSAGNLHQREKTSFCHVMRVRDDYHKAPEVFRLITGWHCWSESARVLQVYFLALFCSDLFLYQSAVIHCEPVLECTENISAVPHKGDPSDNQRVTEIL